MRSATGASIAAILLPSSTQPAPSRRAVTATWLGSKRDCASSVASASFILPSITAGSTAVFCASLPQRSIRRATVTVERKGSTTRPWPRASITLCRSLAPLPKPPWASDTARPSRPSSAKVFQTASLQPVADAMTFLRASKS